MRTHALLALLFLFLIMFDVSDASFVLKLRKLIGPDPNDTKTKDPNHVGETNKDNGSGPISSPVPQPQPQPLPKVMKNTNDDIKKDNDSAPPVSIPPPPKNDDGGDTGMHKGKDKTEGMKFSHHSTTETCDGFKKCTDDDGGMVACISKIGTHCSLLLIIH
ncbi:hypothetical protein glysoja_001129 [Glycine soja]|nr:hypothetical protein glysoja_001129 [Glycine soja]